MTTEEMVERIEATTAKTRLYIRLQMAVALVQVIMAAALLVSK